MLELMIGAASFFCGFALMFAIHRVLFDYYDEDAKQEIYDLKCEITYLKGENYELKAEIEEHKRTLNKINIEVQEIHTFATPADVSDLQFLDN
ncbi:MAG: hypothetical protein J6T10_14235 [Methanobrevibacter sp.]|nr:hypothetical protein [Methanobrevibacter sp.]